jgi:hypothetical protein
MYGYYRYRYSGVGLLISIILVALNYIYTLFKSFYINYTTLCWIIILLIFTIIIYLVINDYIKKNVSSEKEGQKISKHIGKHDVCIKNEVYLESKQENPQPGPSLGETSHAVRV